MKARRGTAIYEIMRAFLCVYFCKKIHIMCIPKSTISASFDKIAKDAGAVLRVCGMVLVDTELVDKFLDANFREESALL